MIYFLGNCQADFLSRAMAARGHETVYKVLASPLTYPSHPGRIPPSLEEIESQFGIEPYLHGRILSHQFSPLDANSSAPELIVLSLFHENTPLFLHDREKYVFFMDPRGLTDNPDLMTWAQNNCRMFKPNPSTYLDRYREMLVRIRAENPGVPIVILARLSHYPAFGPDPFSYLDGWGTLWMKGKAILSAWEKAFDDVHILDMDSVFGGIWSDSTKKIEEHCPFLKIRLEEKDGLVTSLHARRDIEHIGPMPERMAVKLEHFLKTGTIEYGQSETIPAEWQRHWRITSLDIPSVQEKLKSGANYHCAEAVASFFLNLAKDQTKLLVQAKETMPVCHMTLHMVKAYGRIQRNPALAEWCDAHKKAAMQFTANGPLYQQAYLERLDEMKETALTG
ncbi:hypothetical protein [Pseudodesulfovibrio piezophilus]|uniref:Uncharacterized protein n=1 Tax=Pseudodesulfovibrio piezophilus (strain DSM 21447 / JCM 15486 / C1TLV30) TaxID=1322246 RepID=M1WYC6_PSEP2|nr:hypothetical protein [Pseudodesulfovibrio piezophilus]CCH50273.1 conserved protein of unknown function [Pseudodesulfovibrio piezophilus C1TLV30]